MSNYIWGEGQKRSLSPRLLFIKNVLALLTACYVLVAVFIYPEPILHRAICFGLFFAIVFLSYSSPGVKNVDIVPWYDFIFASLSLIISLYIAMNLERLVYRAAYVDEVAMLDYIFAITIIILLLEGTRRIVGHWLSTLSILSLLYIFLGQSIPGRFGHHGFSLSFVVDSLFLTTHGIWGSTIGIATSHILVFIMFGAFLLYSGAGNFLFDFASSLAGSSKGGLAKIAIITSALFGMISGSAIANASTMGVLTIPTMKKQGYSPVFAASVECCSSVGGIFMPPIMGSVAFMMAEIIGIPYIQIAKIALLPALIYFIALFFTIDIRARKLNIEGMKEDDKKPLKTILINGSTYFIPLTYLIIRLMMGISPSRVGVESIALVIITSLTRLDFMKIIKALIQGIDKATMIVTTMATCGIMIGVINTTGISSKFSSFLISLADYSIFTTLIFVMLLAIFLGLAMNITPAYLLTAVMAAPIMIKLGIEPLSAHMFILFFAAMATITPPVAMTAFAAATIAGAPPMKVGFQAMRMGLVAYLLPFVFVYNPAILLIGSPVNIILAFVSAIFAVGIMALSLEGFWLSHPLKLYERIPLFIASCLALMGRPYLVLIAIIITALIYFYHKKKPFYTKEEIAE